MPPQEQQKPDRNTNALAELAKPSNAEDDHERFTEDAKASGELQLKDILERFDSAKRYVDNGLRPVGQVLQSLQGQASYS